VEGHEGVCAPAAAAFCGFGPFVFHG
jgi:hypothetical protein